ncbi:MAG: putative zinc-binding protein [Desulfarculus sp.]|nr:putative zinc-binding protein [Desulfarculus sp.]
MSDSCCNTTSKSADCCSPDGNVMLLACSGGSNVGQLANQACMELTQEGFGKMYCLAGIGGELSGFVASAKDVPRMVVLDGCEVGCAKAIFNKAGVPLRGYVVLTDLGIGKNKNFNLDRAALEKVKDAACQAAQGQS